MTGTDGLALATRGLRKSYGSQLALGGLDLSVPTGHGLRLPRPERRRQDDDDAAPDRPDPPRRRADRAARASRSGDATGDRLFDVGALIESPAFYPYLSGRQNLRALAASGAPVSPGRVEELLELVGPPRSRAATRSRPTRSA